MFEKYIAKTNKFAAIPLPKGKEQLFLSEDGQVFSQLRGLLPIGYDDHGNKTVFADLWNGKKHYKVGLLTLVTYGKLRLQTTYYHLVEPFHINGDKNNCHPSNVGYRYTHPIECEIEPGFYYIPFFNRYVINREGVVKNWTSGKTIKPYVLKGSNKDGRNRTGGYITFGLFSDCGSFTVGRHRLVALTFLPYPDNVDKLDVNHIDGVPGNDWLDNLEWATRKRNCDHAYRAGLRSQNFTIYAKNAITGEEREFYSAQEAARSTGGYTYMILRRIRDPDQTICKDGWLFKGDKDVPWREVGDPKAELRQRPISVRALSKNVFTGEIREHGSIARAGYDLGLESVQAPKTQLLRGFARPYCGYLFKYADDDTPWPEFSERELAVFRDNPKGHARGVIAQDEKGDELFFTNIINAAEHFKQTLKSKNDVIKAIARKRMVDGYRLQYL